VHPDALAALRCPLCRGRLAPAPGALVCEARHSFDVARHGYVSFLVGRPSGRVGDDAAMVAARERFLAAGHFAPITGALAALAAGAGPGIVVEVGAGTAHHLARTLDALPGHAGVAVDLSRHAARRAARAHPRLAAVVADAAALPLADGCAALVLDVFAPRVAGELRRVLREDGALLVARADRAHLAELRPALGLLEVDPEKDRRVREALEPRFALAGRRELSFRMSLDRGDVLALAAMGPSARHLDPEALEARAAALPEPAEVTGAVVIERWAPRP
jgi:23S rRNA (guanine745-N1)-methyltransferase